VTDVEAIGTQFNMQMPFLMPPILKTKNAQRGKCAQIMHASDQMFTASELRQVLYREVKMKNYTTHHRLKLQ